MLVTYRCSKTGISYTAYTGIAEPENHNKSTRDKER